MFVGFKVDKPSEFFKVMNEWNAKTTFAGQFLSPTRYYEVKDNIFGIKIKPLVPKQIFIYAIILLACATLIFGQHLYMSVFIGIFILLLSLYTPLPYIWGLKSGIKREKKDMMIQYISCGEILETLIQEYLYC